MPLAGRQADVRITSVTPTTSTGEATTLVQSTVLEYAVVDDTGKTIWDPDSTPVLYLNSTAVSSTKYEANYVEGRFEFTSTGQAAGTYTADVEYLTASRVAGGREWQLTVETDAFEVTEFGSSGWREFMPNLAGAQVTISRYWADEGFFDLLNSSNSKFLVDLVVNSASGWRYKAFSRVSQDQVNTAVDSIVNEQINLQVDGRVHFTTA
jgi:hypothetical protein